MVRLDKCFVSLVYVLKCLKRSYVMHAAGNCLDVDGAVALGRWLSALTSLQTLDLKGKTRCFVLLFLCR